MKTAYFKGDKAEYTGKSETQFGGIFYEVLMLEGHLKGQSRWIVDPPGYTLGVKNREATQ